MRSFLGLKKNLKFFFAIYIYIYIYLYISISIHISIYISINIYLKKERGLSMRSFQKNATFCLLLHKNVVFFAFFYVLCKRMLRSLRSFTFLRKERKRMHHIQKRTNLTKKRTEKNGAFFFRVKKELKVLFCNIYLYIYISIYQYIYTYIYIYIYKYIFKKRTRVEHAFFSKERNVLPSFA